MEKLITLLVTIFGYAMCCKDGTLLYNTLTSQDKANIVEIHNLYRSCIALGPNSKACQRGGATNQNQPQAANMQEMSWDDAIAEQAQLWANNCEFKHNKAHDSRFQVGQNLAITYSSEDSSQAEVEGAVKLWFGEHKNYQFGPITEEDFKRTGDNQIGHYTQVAWANTYKVGCGYSYYKGNNGMYTKLYVCNYGPSGNFIGQTPYKKGEPNCKAYNLRDASTPGLCAAS